LITYLAPTVLGAKRPVLLIPAKLRKHKTPRELISYGRDWRLPQSLRLISYEQISRDYGDERVVVYSESGQPLPGKCTPELQKIFERCGRAATPAHFDTATQTWTPVGRDQPQTARVFVQVQSFGLLDLADPDLLMLDECHRAKTPSAATTRKINRFAEKRASRAACPIVPVSGTITKAPRPGRLSRAATGATRSM
jgi:hypothetical protein